VRAPTVTTADSVKATVTQAALPGVGGGSNKIPPGQRYRNGKLPQEYASHSLWRWKVVSNCQSDQATSLSWWSRFVSGRSSVTACAGAYCGHRRMYRPHGVRISVAPRRGRHTWTNACPSVPKCLFGRFSRSSIAGRCLFPRIVCKALFLCVCGLGEWRSRRRLTCRTKFK